MSERTEVNHKAPAQDQGAEMGRKVEAAERSWPSHEQRLAQILDYQARALENDDPHLANILLFDGDTMLLALKLRELMDKDLIEGTTTAEATRRFGQRAEMFLKAVRQIDRNARIKRQLVQLAKEDSGLG